MSQYTLGTDANSQMQSQMTQSRSGLANFYAKLTQAIVDQEGVIVVSSNHDGNIDERLAETATTKPQYDKLYFRTLRTKGTEDGLLSSINPHDHTDTAVYGSGDESKEPFVGHGISLTDLDVWYGKLTDALFAQGGEVVISVSSDMSNITQQHNGAAIPLKDLLLYDLSGNPSKDDDAYVCPIQDLVATLHLEENEEYHSNIRFGA